MVEERVQRRLAAILAADVVGYSSLMEKDEAGTLARLQSLRAEIIDPIIAKHGGRIVKTMGDGLLVEFGSAVAAVENALDIQTAMAQRERDHLEGDRIQFRVGINLGDVIIDGDDIHGEGVNVAARLEGLCEPGDVYISGSVHDQVSGKVDTLFTDLGEQTVKNIERPVRVYRAMTTEGTTHNPKTTDQPLTNKPSIAVLPFTNLSGDQEQAYFADGLTEDIITALSASHAIPVIARDSTFAYKGTSPNVRRVAEDLDVRYVIEGSVRRAGNRLRINVQLIDATSGQHVWAENMDRDLDDIFTVQDEITRRIAATVEPEIERSEQKKLAIQRPANLDAWGCYQRGMSWLFDLTHESNLKAQELCERAIALDPEYAHAHVGLAFACYRDILLGYKDSLAELEASMLNAAKRAVALDRADSATHWILGLAFHITRQYERAIASAKRAVELNPYRALNFIGLGVAFLFAGRSDEAVPNLETGLTLNPRDPRNHIYLTLLARAHLDGHRYEKVLEYAQAASARNSDFLDAHLIIASSLGHLGRVEEGLGAVRECERLNPGSTRSGAGVVKFLEFDGSVADDGSHRMHHEHFIEGIQKVRIS